MLASALKEVAEHITFCAECFRSVERESPSPDPILCSFCHVADGSSATLKRNQNQIAVVEKESDLRNIEETRVYQGVYHVLGGVISGLDPESPKKIHLRELYERVKKILEAGNACELILATSATTEGDTTALYIEKIMAPLKDAHPAFKISRLGRGLSLGSELEYADEMTIKNALNNRK